jgi:GNAT superfamily N-acetyltransferase
MSQRLIALACSHLRHATSSSITLEHRPRFTRFKGPNFVCALDIRPPVVRIIAMGVNEAERRNGIGSRLLGGIHRFCHVNQLVPMVPLVRDSDEARAFWEYHGYTPSDDNPDCWVIPGWQWDQQVAE